ncbi:hypothetical protein ACFL12_00845 [Pseudomonadota bacterium]
MEDSGSSERSNLDAAALQKLAWDLSMMDTRDGEELLLQAMKAELILEEKSLGLEVYAVEGGMVYAYGLSGGLRKFITTVDLEKKPMPWLTNTVRKMMH